MANNLMVSAGAAKNLKVLDRMSARGAKMHRPCRGPAASTVRRWRTRLPRRTTRPPLLGPAVPELFDVITFFRARGDSYPIIASIGFWTEENPGKALTASALKIWYELELKRRVPAKPSGPRRP